MNPNSALIWLPKIKEAGLPLPRTIIVPYDHQLDLARMYVDHDAARREIDAVAAACEQIGYPCFIRTDLASAKHSGPHAYLAQGPADVPVVMGLTIEDNEMKFWTAQPPQAFLVREYLELDAPFTAFGGLPIAREWRYFADESGVRCKHFYWPEEAIQFFRCAEADGWRDKLTALHDIDPRIEERIAAMSRAAVAACGGGYWSVDWACDRSGKWWLIDMARGQDSWHPEDCDRMLK